MLTEPLDPATATAQWSIWKDIDRKALELQALALSKKQHVAGPRTYTKTSSAKNDDSYPLPFEIEKSLADDFAFIAACQPTVDFVSAVSMEQDPKQCSLVVRLAANGGVAAQVTREFNEILAVLKERARRDITRDFCQERLLELIIQLNRNKILGRVGSTKFVPPAHLVKIRDPLPGRLRQFFRSNTKAAVRRQKLHESNTLDQHIKDFETAFTQLESKNSAGDTLNLGRAIKQAFVLTEDGVSLPSRLRALGCPEHLLDTRDVREVGKVGNYWRISRHLMVCSSRFRSYFANIQLCPLPSYRASVRSQVIDQQFIHAEIQLLVHYGLRGLSLQPRAIGVSKEACFLCDSFLRADGQFSFTGAHRSIFPQWAVPDLKEYSPSTVQHFRRILLQVVRDVQQEHSKAKKKLPWRPFPPQSAINLNVARLPTPSASTLPLPPSVDSASATQVIHSSSNNTASMPSQVVQPGRTPKQRRQSTSSIAELQESSDRAQEILQDVPIQVKINREDRLLVDWISTFAYFSSRSIDETFAPEQEQFTSGNISLEPTRKDHQGRIIFLNDIPTERDLVLERESVNDDDPHEISFVIVGNRGESVRYRCQWHCS